MPVLFEIFYYLDITGIVTFTHLNGFSYSIDANLYSFYRETQTILGLPLG